MNNGSAPSSSGDAGESNLLEIATSWETILAAYDQARIGFKKFKMANIKYHRYYLSNLVRLRSRMLHGTYYPGKYITFYVYEPKERLVHAPHLEDKIVQFAVHIALQDLYYNKFITNSYACLRGRGSIKGAKRIQQMMRQAAWMHDDPYILKLDARKFFYSINRDILKDILRKKIYDQKFLELLDRIIDSSPEGEKGIPLGNVTSQDFANIYLNELDQFSQRFLGIKWYARYMDDVIAVLPNKEAAQEALVRMASFMKEKLDLDINDKTKIFPIKQGVNALGYKIFTTHMLVRDQSKRAMKRRIKGMNVKIDSGELDEKYVKQCVESWLGYARYSNSYNLAKKIFDAYDYIDVESKKHNFGRSEQEGKKK